MTALAGQPLPVRCLALTALFETGARAPKCFGVTSGSDDGQGISWGAIQFALRPGTLSALLRDIDARDRGAIDRVFGATNAATLRRVMAAPTFHALEWADTIQVENGKRLAPPWQRSFEALGLERAAQDAQAAAAKWRFDRARDMCAEYGLWSERAVALMFDIVVQHGSIASEMQRAILAEFAKSTATERAAIEVGRMVVIGRIRSAVTRPQFRAAVLARRLCVANGVGSVHGMDVDLERDFGIGLRPHSPA